MLGAFGPISEDESVKKIIKCSDRARKDLPLLMFAHSGPTGLGSQPNSICGKDWKIPASDWGDRDLAIAITKIQKDRFIDLVVFGHMHHQLKRNLGFRKMFKIDKTGTAYLNAAVVPRYKRNNKGILFTNFSWVEFKNNKLNLISQRWYSDSGVIEEEEIFFQIKI